MNNERYVVSYEVAGKVYVLGKSRPILLSSRSLAVGAVRKVFESAMAGNVMAAVAATFLDFRIHRAQTIPSRTTASQDVLPGLSGVILRSPLASAWHARGARPYVGSKVPRRTFAKKKSSRYNTRNQPAYGS